MAKLKEGLETIDVKSWKPKHENFNQKFSKPTSYRLTNPNKGKSSLSRYNDTTKNMMFLIEHALINKIQVRPIGRGWSFTKISFGKNGFIDTLSLRLAMRLRQSHLHDSFVTGGGSKDDVWFVQCGNSIRAINGVLEKKRAVKRSILASGASNGQTIAGATSTGTHGGAFDVGAVHDAIVGLHIVTGPDRHVYVQRASNPIVNDSFTSLFGVSEVILDDDVFNAAVVSFGSFGIIHGVLLKTDPIFLLENYRDRVSLTPTIKAALGTLNFADFNLKASQTPASAKLYHFQVIINPYNIALGERGLYLIYKYKLPYNNTYEKRTLSDRGHTYGDDTLGALAKLLKSIPFFRRNAIKLAIANILPLQYPSSETFPWFGTMGETFTYTSLKGKTGSCAIGIDHTDTPAVLDIIVNIVENNIPFIGLIALRYVKGTQATLGFTKYPITCVVELDGVDTKKSREFFDLVCTELKSQSIDFTLHWGKLNDYLQNNPLTDFYDASAISSWKNARKQVFNNARAQKVFDNQFIKNVGLI